MSAFAAVVAAASCSDRSSVGLIAPGHARLALAPRFALVPGAPTIPLSRLEGSLTSPAGQVTVQKATFTDGEASLTFDVLLPGDSADFVMDLVSFDTDGNEAYRAQKVYRIRAGLNEDLEQPEFVYTAADSKLVSLQLHAGAATIDAGGTTQLSVTGAGPNEAPISPIRVGYTSRSTDIATVDDAGKVTAKQLKGTTYIVARTPANLADSMLITTRGAVAQVVAPPTLGLFTGATANLAVEMRDPAGSVITDRPLTFASSNNDVATVSGGGVVTGVGVGVANITATVEGVTATTVVTVSASTLTVLPGTSEKLPNGTQQFTVTGGAGPFTWQVNGVTGGNDTFGTITPQGFYTAPRAVPTPASFDVCATQESPSLRGCARVTINPIPTSGADVIVFNDINFMDNGVAATNAQLFKNMAQFPSTGARSTSTAFMRFRGHSSKCSRTGECAATSQTAFASTLQSINVPVVEVDDSTATLTTIAPEIKTILLLNPTTPFSIPEINAMKKFASEGGRIIFVGEHYGYYGPSGTSPNFIETVENPFLAAMGAVLRNPGINGKTPGSGVYACPGNATGTGIRAHQLSTGVTTVAFACSTELELGPNDFAIFTFVDQGAERILVAAAKIDVTPIETPQVNRRPAALRATTATVSGPANVPAGGPGVPGWREPPK